MKRRYSPVLPGCTALLLVACEPAIEVPLPDLSRVERDVVDKVESCRTAVLRDPSAKHWTHYALVLHAHQMLAEAEQAYLQAAGAAGAGDSQVFESLHMAGLAALEGRAEHAVEHFQRALALRDDFMPTHLCLAIIAERLGRADLAERHYRRVLELAPSSHAHLGLGRLELRAGNAAAAVVELQKAVALNPRHREVYEALARAHTRLGAVEQSRQAAARAGDLAVTTHYVDPLLGKVAAEAVDVNSRFSRGSTHANAGRHAKAIVEFMAVVRARPRHVNARFNLALLYQRTNDLARARQHLELILEQQPNHERARKLLASLQ